jgi:hypothetical protein
MITIQTLCFVCIAAELAFNVLGKVFSTFHKKGGGMELKVTEVIEKLMDTSSKTSLYILRLLSFMDKNNDYSITKDGTPMRMG